jgi:hypothetical protein
MLLQVPEIAALLQQQQQQRVGGSGMWTSPYLPNARPEGGGTSVPAGQADSPLLANFPGSLAGLQGMYAQHLPQTQSAFAAASQPAASDSVQRQGIQQLPQPHPHATSSHALLQQQQQQQQQYYQHQHSAALHAVQMQASQLPHMNAHLQHASKPPGTQSLPKQSPQ